MSAPTRIIGPRGIVDGFHAECARAIEASFQPKYNQLNGTSYGVAEDMNLWSSVLRPRTEFPLLETASSEYVLAYVSNSQAQYRNAFKGLRLSLELVLQGTYLSTDLVTLMEWLASQADTTWHAIVDIDNGIFSARFCKAFFPDLVEYRNDHQILAVTLYREMSECIHGNVPNRIPLPKTSSFDEATFLLWHQKASTLRLIINFVLTLRYVSTLSESDKMVVAPAILEQLGHVEPVRRLFGGPVDR